MAFHVVCSVVMITVRTTRRLALPVGLSRLAVSGQPTSRVDSVDRQLVSGHTMWYTLTGADECMAVHCACRWRRARLCCGREKPRSFVFFCCFSILTSLFVRRIKKPVGVVTYGP